MDGSSVGSPDGSLVGDTVGVELGDEDGLEEGSLVGVAVGVDEGSVEGSSEGITEGDELGDFRSQVPQVSKQTSLAGPKPPLLAVLEQMDTILVSVLVLSQGQSLMMASPVFLLMPQKNCPPSEQVDGWEEGTTLGVSDGGNEGKVLGISEG